jgi:molybdopterin/thiamine biosynthesis adenylyltransferase
MNRYLRQMVLPQIGARGRTGSRPRMCWSSAPAGLGVPVLQYLAGAGIGAITLIDPDRVEETNLHRQPGQRALMAADRLRERGVTNLALVALG